MFVAKLARSVGRLDFWNVYAELTPYELAVHMAISDIEPWGEDRADMRMAINTLNLLQAQSSKQFSASQSTEIVKALTGYLRFNKENATSMTPEDVAKLGKESFAGTGI